MRVLQINSVCGYGSTGRIATDLYDILEREGHESCIAYGRGSSPEGYNTIKIGNKFDFYSHVLKTRLFDLHGFGSTRATKNFIKQIEEYKPDIIHLHNIHGYYVNVEILFNYFSTKNIPVVWLLHDQWAFSGHSAYFNLDISGNIPNKNLSDIQKNEYPKSWMLDNSVENFKKKNEIFTQVKNMTIVTPSVWLKDLAMKSFLSKYPIEVIYNGIDLDKFKPTKSDFRQKNGLNNEKVLLGVASVWDERKGLKYFEKLSQELSNEFKIVLVGIDEKDSSKLNPKIIGIKRTASVNELAEIYSSADVFINPTLEDNFPTTNIESLACGTPVITFNTGGSAESLDQNSGIVIEKGDINMLISTIDSMAFNDLSKENCIKRANAFNKNNKFMEYLQLYKEVLK